MTDAAQPAADAPEHTFMQRMLDGIERLGNKMPDPAILFLWLCLGVILLSQASTWLDVKATYEVVEPPPVARGADLLRRLQPADLRRADRARAGRRTTRSATETTKVKGLLTGRRRALPVHVVRRQLPQLRRGRDHPGGDDRRRPGRGGRADRGADPQARRGVLEQHADVHHRAARDDLERRLRRRLPGADTARGGRVQERRAQPAGRDRGRVRRRRRRASG